MAEGKIGGYVLWRQYGFRHIIKDDKKTLCGNNWGFNYSRYRTWSKEYDQKAKTLGEQGFVEQACSMKLMADHYRDKVKFGAETEHRPLCGSCRKFSIKVRE